MAQKRSRNAILSYGSFTLYTVATLAGGLFSSRLIIAWTGETRFGAFRTLVDTLGYLTLLEFGLSGAVGPLLARSLGTGDRAALRDVLAASMRAYLGVMVLGGLLGLVLVAGLPWIVPVPAANMADLRLAGLVGLMTCMTLPLLPLRSLADAAQRGYQISLLLLLQFLVITGTALFLCGRYPQWGITGQAFAMLVGAITLNLCLCWLTLRREPGLLGEAIRTRPPASIWASVWMLSWPTVVLQVSGRVSVYSDNLILGQILGVTAVTSLFVTQRLAQVAGIQLAAIGSAAWAPLAELYHHGEHDLFRRRLLELFRLVTILGVATIGPIICFNRPFLRLWMGAERGATLDGGTLIVVLAGLNGLIAAVLSICGWSVTAIGRVRALARPSLVFMVIYPTASILMTRAFGLVGPLLGGFTTYLTFSVWYYAYLLKREFSLSRFAMARSILVPLAWGLPYILAWWWIATAQDQIGWIALGAQMGTAALGFLILSAVVILGPQERAIWRDRLARTLGSLPLFGRRKQPVQPLS